MSYPYDGQRTTDKENRKWNCMYTLLWLILFPVWAGIDLLNCNLSWLDLNIKNNNGSINQKNQTIKTIKDQKNQNSK